MSNFPLLVYLYFKDHKITFYLFLLLCVLFIVTFISGLKLEEQITGTSKITNATSRFDYAVSHGKFTEKLIITIHLSDSLAQPDPDKLENFAQNFLDSLDQRFDSSYISIVNGKVADSSIQFYIDYIYSHLPLFMEEEDYLRLDSLIQPAQIESRMKANYKSLVSPAGFAMKGMILRDPLGIGYPLLAKLRPQEVGDNYTLHNGFVVTKDLRNLLVFVTPSNPPAETSQNGRLVNGINDILERLKKESNGSVQGSCFGSAAMAVGNAEQLKADIAITFLAALALIFLLIGWYYRSFKIPFLGFLPALFGGGIALSLLSIMNGTISAIALGVGSVILGLIVDYALYMINHFRKKGDIEVVIKEMSLTIFLCSITTAGAFLCLVFLNSTVLHDLGLFAAFSVLGAAFFTLFIFPHFISGLKFSPLDNTRGNIVDRIARYKFEKQPFLLVFLVLAGVAAFFTLSKVDFEKDMMSLNYAGEEMKTAERDVNRITNVSMKNLYMVSTGKNLDEAISNQEIAEVKLETLKKDGVVASYSGMGSMLMDDEEQNKRIERWNAFWTKEIREKLENRLNLTGKRFHFKEDAFISFFSLINKEYQPIDSIEREKTIKQFGSEWFTRTDELVMITSIAKVEPANKQAVYNAFSDREGIVLFDKQMLANRFVERVKEDFDLLVALSMVFVTLLLLFSFGRIELGLITALPMFFSWLITLGFMGITGARFNIFNIIISSFIFGLGVDYSILMMRSLQYRLKYGIDETNSYKVAVLLSSTTTLFGVGALFFAKHPALHSIALISVVGILLVVLISFTFLPLLVNRFIIQRTNDGKFPVTARIFVKTVITWWNIVFIAILMMLMGVLLRWVVPISRRKKEQVFHSLFSKLSGLYITITFPPSARRLINENGEDFSKPAIIIANHQSLIETPGMLRLYPKILILTTSWVWNSPLFGPIARLASFYNVDEGIDSIIDQLRAKTEEGFSILIYPEGHRSADHKIQRFHRGAFYLAEKLQLDILPIVQFGSGNFLPKNAFWGRPDCYHMKILPRVTPQDTSFGSNYSERSRNFRKYFSQQYEKFKAEYGTGSYYRRKLVLHYIYKGPVLEWYMRVKMKLSGYYQQYNKLVPRTGEVTDLGCGYGFISYMLYLTGENRKVTGVDHDSEKIEVAKHGYLANSNTQFISCDITRYEFVPQDAFVLSDVLHYLPEESQEKLLVNCIRNLRPGGVILIRDADSKEAAKHRGTKLTELLSTRILGFNKTGTNKQLHFTTLEKILQITKDHSMEAEVLEEAEGTSNILVSVRHAKK